MQHSSKYERPLNTVTKEFATPINEINSSQHNDLTTEDIFKNAKLAMGLSMNFSLPIAATEK